jgi:ribose transport system ATP-binding protein
MGVGSGTGQDVVLGLRGITKSFPGVVALDNVDLVIHRNEIVGLVGENGAGKSVLMKTMVGLLQPDEGAIELEGRPITLRDTSEAIRNGIGMVFQEGSLAPNLTVTENLFLRHEERFARLGFFSLRSMRDAARELLAELGIHIDVDQVVSEIGPAARQMVEIARLLWLSRLYGRDNPVLILDEPTAVLGDQDREMLFTILRELKKRASVVFISHRLQEIIENCDRICVLKDGKNVTEMGASDARAVRIEEQMVGHSFSADRFHEDQQQGSRGGREILKVENLSRAGLFAPISFTVGEGEIVSLIGLVGSGKEEICKCIAGMEKAETGSIFMDGRNLPAGSPRSAVLAGVGHVPVDRRSEGLALMMSVAQNVNLLVLSRLKTAGLLSPAQERKNAQHWVSECQIKTPSLSALCANLSGGNQQKTVISKWLSSRVRLLVLDHPTRGVDVGAKDELYKLMRRLATQGIGMIIMCDTLEEDIGLSDRMLVMKDGQLVQEVDSSPQRKPSPQSILSLMV